MVQKEYKQVDIDKINAFRTQINRVSKNAPGASEVKALYLKLSDDAVKLLIDFSAAPLGLNLDSSKVPMLVSAAKVDYTIASLNFLRANIGMQLDMYALPRIYKDIFIDFIVSGYKKDNEQKIVRKLVLYYIRTDRESEDFNWVDFDYIDSLMKRTSKDDPEGINSIHRDYFIGLYENAHKAVRRILELAVAVGAGRRPHNLIRRLAKDDRYVNIPEYPSDSDQPQRDKWLFSRLAKMFDLGVQVLTRKEAIKQINEAFRL
jgi:hypothetical protein